LAERTEYKPGTFSWVDLTTPDQDAAKAFYSALLGWEANDIAIGDGVFYSMMTLAGKRVAAISPQPSQQRDAGAPPAWNSYITVADADAASERAKELGGTVHAPAWDVMDAGRMAVIQDPQGAYFAVWQPRGTHGAELVTEVGAFVWNELATTDVDGAGAFYGELFGWTLTPVDFAPQRYLVIGPQPAFWLVYFGVADIDRGIAKVEELGGRKYSGPIELPMAKIAIVGDAQGAVFALYSGTFEP
jgi:predicted enzyme related to lactoylglutathione lyase